MTEGERMSTITYDPNGTEIRDWIQKAVNIHENIAADVFPGGGTLTCEKCGEVEFFTTTDAAQYLSTGWPKHCGLDMTLETADAVNGVERS